MSRTRPKYVIGCSIRNESNDDVQVQVTHEYPEQSPEQYSVDLSNGEAYTVEPKRHDIGSCSLDNRIQMIDVVLANGTQLHVEHPLDGVIKIHREWQFIIHEDGIEALPSDS